ncbi:MAG: hypothetical protein LBR76_01730 [Oscillospiraceae bacterium]|jgi:hypothetical protein|nr:hypothetical protein [Oscillospiraceae bacterium]
MSSIRRGSKRSEIPVYLNDDEDPAFIVRFTPGDMKNVVYIDQINTAYAALKSAAEIQDMAVLISRIEQNFDAMTDPGTYALISRNDTGGDYGLLQDVLGEIARITTAERDQVLEKYRAG